MTVVYFRKTLWSVIRLRQVAGSQLICTSDFGIDVSGTVGWGSHGC